MHIRTLHHTQGAREASGTAVVIDVYRAFTTACFMAAGNAGKIIPVADLEEAYRMKMLHPQYILAGERNGIKQEGFDYGNSPAAVSQADFSGRTVVLTTSAGTQGLVEAYRHADEVLTGSFVNAQATAKRILESSPGEVSLVCMGWNNSEPADEDICYAAYLESLLRGKPMDFSSIARFLRYESTTQSFLHTHDDPDAQQRDLDLCLSLDRFSFVLKYEEDPQPVLIVSAH